MKKFSLVTIAVATISVLGAAGCGNTEGAGQSDEEVVKIGCTGKSFPDCYKEDGELTGYDVDVAEAVAADAGIKLDWTLTSFSGLMGQLESRRLDTVANAVSVTAEREQQYDFSVPYLVDGTQVAVKSDRKDIGKIDDLAGMTVAGVSGSANVEIAEANLPESSTVRTYDDRQGAMQDTTNGRVDGYVNTKSEILARINREGLELKLVGDPMDVQDIALPFLKDDDSAGELREKFSNSLEKLTDDGTLSKLGEEYFGPDFDIGVGN